MEPIHTYDVVDNMTKKSSQSISIIIPTLNEEKNISNLLPYLRSNFSSCEIIISDGGSSDKTVALAQNFCKVVHSSKGRGLQLNNGAEQASGNILWFLHADTIPHANSLNYIQDTMKNIDTVGGGFEYNFDSTSKRLQFISWFSNKKNIFLNRIYGDMGIFVRKDIFGLMGGFAESHLMEDFEFSRRLRKIGKVIILPEKIKTSPRDWYKEGFLKKVTKDTFIRMAYCMNVDNQTLYNWYYGVKR